MGARYDGSIRIDSKVDTKGFENGISSMEKMVKGLAAVIAAALGAKLAGGILKLSGEFQRLELAARAVGQMFGYTADQVKEITSQLVDSGIQTDVANKAFINFAREGLDTNLLPALARGAQDLNTFAEAGATSSDVLDRLLHGIMTLSPIVLRHAGVAIDLEQSYKEYAKAAGTSAAALTIQEKRQAALVAVTQKLTGVTGLYVLSQQTAAGQLASNTRIVNEFKAAIGRPFQSAFFIVIKAWNSLLKAWSAAIRPGGRLYGLLLNMAAAAKILASVIASLFSAFAAIFGIGGSAIGGAADKTKEVADNTEDAAKNQENLAKATAKSGKAAKGALASFDELNVLQQDSGGAAGPDDGGGGIVPDLSGFDTTVSELEGLAERVEILKGKFAAFFGPIIQGFNNLGVALAPLTNTLWEGLKWAWDNILVPMGSWVMTEAAPEFLNILGSAAEFLNNVLAALQPLGIWLWENFLQPLGSWAGDAFVDVLRLINDAFEWLGNWVSTHQAEVERIAILVGAIATAMTLVSVAGGIFTAVMGVATAVATGFGAVMAFITSPIGLVVAAIAGLIILLLYLARNWDSVKKKAGEVWASMKKTYEEAAAWFQKNVIDPIVEGFNKGMEAIGKAWEPIWDGIVEFVKQRLNSIIDVLNALISGAISGLNQMIKMVNSIKVTIPDWVPNIGGKTFGVNLKLLESVQIPRLATGAVIPPNSEFAAILGDQRSGRNIEAPEGLIRQILQEELGSLDANIQINFGGSMASLIRQLRPAIVKNDVRIGRNMVGGNNL